LAHTPHIALLIETSTAYGRELLRGVAQYARFHGPWSFYIEPGDIADNPPDLAAWQVDGVIARIRSQRLADALLATGVPTVDVDFALPELLPYGLANHDARIATLAAEHLLACGLSHFAFVGWAPDNQAAAFWESARFKHFAETLAPNGAQVHQYHWPKNPRHWSWPREQKHLARWLKTLPKPIGIMASNDQRARHVLEAARLADLEIPRDLAVIGVDNDEVLCEMSSPSLSSVAVNAHRIGYEAAKLLHRLMAGKKPPPRRIVVEPLGVIARQSTDTLAMADEAVVAALRYIRNHIDKPIRVADILTAVPVSRKTLEVRFAKVLGRTPHAEIHRVRLERVKTLLAQTDWSLKKIAAASGFTYAEHMHSVFRKQTNMTPSQYRHQHREH
jgi:LacI family transcriptional regulator